ncbi:hypothetical protein C8F01DRAFT_1321489 [Mycena amicta]|nr:hypothetical protein C8F01DRAFT_1321489 [Mycena amicta]
MPAQLPVRRSSYGELPEKDSEMTHAIAVETRARQEVYVVRIRGVPEWSSRPAEIYVAAWFDLVPAVKVRHPDETGCNWTKKSTRNKNKNKNKVAQPGFVWSLKGLQVSAPLRRGLLFFSICELPAAGSTSIKSETPTYFDVPRFSSEISRLQTREGRREESGSRTGRENRSQARPQASRKLPLAVNLNLNLKRAKSNAFRG